MTGPKGNSEFWFPKDPEVKGNQNSLFPEWPVIKCFAIPPNSRIEKNCDKMSCLKRRKALLPVRTAVKLSCTTEMTQ